MSASLQYKNVILFKLCTDNHFVDDYARFSTLDTKEKSTAVANSMNYMTKKGESEKICPKKYNRWKEKDYVVSREDDLIFKRFWTLTLLLSSPPPLPPCLCVFKNVPPSGMTTTNRHGNHPFPPCYSLSSALALFSVFCEQHCWQCSDVFVNPPQPLHLCYISQST